MFGHLGMESFSEVAISGGGPYLAHIVTEMPQRLISIHMLAAATRRPATDPVCTLSSGALADLIRPTIQNPTAWWAFANDSPTFWIPGFVDRAHDEGARAFFVRGQMGDPALQVAEAKRYCDPVADISAVRAPAFIYQGTADLSVPMASADYWRMHFPNMARMRVYPGEGHDIQYRLWDQVLVDLSGHSDLTVVCARGRSRALPEAKAQVLLKTGAAPGICAWRR